MSAVDRFRIEAGQSIRLFRHNVEIVVQAGVGGVLLLRRGLGAEARLVLDPQATEAVFQCCLLPAFLCLEFRGAVSVVARVRQDHGGILVDAAHQQDLLTPLGEVALIDADAIRPEPGVRVSVEAARQRSLSLVRFLGGPPGWQENYNPPPPAGNLEAGQN